ncbi:hypothetical protein [Prauserella flavalba]|uniref:hypothetical protein n=1 Tax=Prauserella flavalba TaxID=1477506 RepID=UPI001FE5D012|nr:hypothetical protein [Prauserella flavalba]
MTYDPYHGSDPYRGDPRAAGYADRAPGTERRRDDGANTVIALVRAVVSVVVAVFVLHILFVVLDANQGNGFVATIYTVAKALVLGLGDVFTPEDAVLGVVMNYGLAALLYLVLGQFVIKALRRP